MFAFIGGLFVCAVLGLVDGELGGVSHWWVKPLGMSSIGLAVYWLYGAIRGRKK
jgi:hypothetical protein